jgi:histidinol-phosphate aminotransferase
MTGYVPGEQPRGRRVIKLNTNENPYPPSPKVAEVLHSVDIAELRKYPDPVASAMRARVAEIHDCKPDNVFVGNGSDEILALCTRAFVENDGTIGFFDPSYSLYPILSEIRDVRQMPVPLGDGFGWKRPAADLGSLFLLTNPNAPTSILFARNDVEEFCREFQGVVLIDEAYVDFAAENLMDLALKYENVLVMRTLSKSFSLAAMRVGYVVGHPDLIAALMKIKDSYNLDAIAQVLGLAALNDLDYMHANAKRIMATRERLRYALVELGFDLCPSQTNFLWTVPPPQMTAAEFFEELKQRDILIRYFAHPGIDRYVRITVGTDAEIDALLAATQTIVKESCK